MRLIQLSEEKGADYIAGWPLFFFYCSNNDKKRKIKDNQGSLFRP